MGKIDYKNRWNAAVGDIYEAALHNADRQGIQDEFEERTEAVAPDILVLGNPQIIADDVNDKVDIYIPAGSAIYCHGKKINPSPIPFSPGDPTGTYYIFWDDSANDTAKATAPPAGDNIKLATVNWNSATLTLSGLVNSLPTPGVRPASHASTHQAGGSDEINLTGLRGVLAEPQIPKDHPHTAQNVSIADTGNYFVSNDVEGALQEIGYSRDHEIVAHGILSIAHDDTAAASPQPGDIIRAEQDYYYYSGETRWRRYPAGEQGQSLRISNGMPAWTTDIFSIGVAVPGEIAVTSRVAALKYTLPMAGTLTRARLELITPPSGSDLIVDVEVNGTSVWSSTPQNRVRVAAGQTSGVQTSFDRTELNAGDAITFDINQVGSTTPGAGLTIQLDIARK